MELKSKFFKQLISDFITGFIKKKTKVSTLNIYVEECAIDDHGDDYAGFKLTISGTINKNELKKLVSEVNR